MKLKKELLTYCCDGEDKLRDKKCKLIFYDDKTYDIYQANSKIKNSLYLFITTNHLTEIQFNKVVNVTNSMNILKKCVPDPLSLRTNIGKSCYITINGNTAMTVLYDGEFVPTDLYNDIVMLDYLSKT